MTVADLPEISPALDLSAAPPPLRLWEDGSVRVGTTRLLFVLVVRAFQEGEPPEGIVRRYEGVPLADVYGAVNYYLQHRAAVDAYVTAYDLAGQATRRKVEAEQRDLTAVRDRLVAAGVSSRSRE